jgi:hypothetical protein
MNNKRKTAIYCRVALADKGKIAAQEARLRAYADEHSHNDIVCYADDGTAGTTLDRTAMNALTADIKAGKIGAVLAVNLSRIARALVPMLEWHRLTREHGIAFVTLADGEQNAAAETLELTYRLVGDYLLPNLALSDPPDAEPLRHYGRMRRAFLKEHRPALYSELLLSEKLFLWRLKFIEIYVLTRTFKIADKIIFFI